MLSRPIDPRRCNTAVDNNAIDRLGGDQDTLVDRFRSLMDGGTIRVILPRGVRREVLHERTPDAVKAVLAPQIYTLDVEHSDDERARYARLKALVQGNARPGKHAADIDHLFESGKYCSYFVTHDKRILNLRQNISEVLGSHLHVVTMAEFLEIFDATGPRPFEEDAMPSLPDHQIDMEQRGKDKARATAALDSLLSSMERRERQLDAWERQYIATGINALFRGAYGLAISQAINAMTPLDERHPKPTVDAQFDRFNLSTLRQALTEAKEEPVRPFAHIGPIVFDSGDA